MICNNHVDVNVCTISPHLEWIEKDSPAEPKLFMFLHFSNV